MVVKVNKYLTWVGTVSASVAVRWLGALNESASLPGCESRLGALVAGDVSGLTGDEIGVVAVEDTQAQSIINVLVSGPSQGDWVSQ